jgi:hypothetical protein
MVTGIRKHHPHYILMADLNTVKRHNNIDIKLQDKNSRFNRQATAISYPP